VVWNKTTNLGPKKGEEKAEDKWPKEREDNILYFIEKYAPDLPAWKREIIRIVRKTAQYFYPQAQTKTLNEGFATFTHYYIMTRMYEKGLLTEGSYLEFLQSHTNVVYQPDFDKRYFSGMNPYALGFAIFMDIKRICEAPTEEDKQWMPHLIGRDWVEAIQDAMMNYKDESFIHQFLSPKVIRDFNLFSIRDDGDLEYVEITAIHNDEGYIKVRNALADSYNRANWVPDLQVDEVDVLGDRCMYIVHTPYQGRSLDIDAAKATIGHIANLWEFDVVVETPTHLDDGDPIEYIAKGPKTPK
jgi:stage V sporulation protein R